MANDSIKDLEKKLEELKEQQEGSKSKKSA